MRDDNPTKKSRQCYLVNEETKEAKIATIVGQRIIDGTSAPFYDEKKRGQYRRAIWRILQLLRKERSQQGPMLDQTP